jgi:hypothetical protein
MDKIKVLEEIKLNSDKIDTMLRSSESDGRTLTASEVDSLTNLKIRNIELNREFSEKNVKFEEDKTEKFSLIRSINAKIKGVNISDVDRDVIAKGESNLRAAGQVADGLAIPISHLRGAITLSANQIQGNQVDKLNVIANSLVFNKVGATYGVYNTEFTLPSISQSNCFWAGEGETAQEGQGTISFVKLSPKRLTAQIPVDKKFLAMDTIDAEQVIINDLVNAISRKIESTCLGKLSGNTDMPAGIFYSAPSISGTTTYTNVISVEEKLQTNNGLGGNLAWITHPKVKTLFRTTAKLANGQPIMEDNNTAISYPLYVSNAVASGLQSGTNEYGAVLADWSNLFIAQFGDAIDLTVDTNTLATKAQVLITVNFYVDFAFRNSAYYATASFK